MAYDLADWHCCLRLVPFPFQVPEWGSCSCWHLVTCYTQTRIVFPYEYRTRWSGWHTSRSPIFWGVQHHRKRGKDSHSLLNLPETQASFSCPGTLPLWFFPTSDFSTLPHPDRCLYKLPPASTEIERSPPCDSLPDGQISSCRTTQAAPCTWRLVSSSAPPPHPWAAPLTGAAT